MEKRNEERYKTNQQHGKNYDSKNMMHTIRLLQSAEQILQQEDEFWQTSTTLVKQGINAQNGLPYLASGINYSRVTPFANLYQYNEPDHNTGDARLFEQALSELYRASNKTKFVDNATYKQIKNTITSNKPDSADL